MTDNKKQTDYFGGRPRKRDTEEELEQRVNIYFETLEKDSKPTITGLALALGFKSRQSFYDYEKEDEFSYSIKRSRLRIEEVYEQGLRNNSTSGPIFALKNLGWTDRVEIEQTNIEGTVKEEDLED